MPRRSPRHAPRTRPGLPLAAWLAIALIWPATASAHLGSTKYIRVERTAEGAHLAVAVDAVDCSVELGLGEDVDERALMGRARDIQRWLAEGIVIESGGHPCRATAGLPRIAPRDGRPFVEIEIGHACVPPIEEVWLADSTVFDTDGQHEAFVRVLWSGDESARILRRGRQRVALGEPPSTGALVLLFLREGVTHLATGYDHVLFLLSLILAAGLVAVAQGRRRALRDVAIVVTAFTIGHSVTLFGAALGVVVLPSRVVETAIAASILIVAGVNLVKPEARRGMPWLAFAFGLVHGFGFSAVLAEQGLPRGQQVLALLSFNVGIEVGQLTFVVLLMGPLTWAASSKRYRDVVVRGGSALIAAVAAVWLVQRAFGL